MADPIQRGGGWWTQRDDGSWLKWDEASKSWQPSGDPPPPEDAGLPPVPPMPVGTSGYSATPLGAQTPIPNYLVWSILVTIFCFLPTGIAAIVFSTQVDSKLAAGDRAGALESSNKAKTWIIVSVVAGLVVGVIWFGIVMSNVNNFDINIDT
jgi:Interferon-induced transmembrane protein